MYDDILFSVKRTLIDRLVRHGLVTHRIKDPTRIFDVIGVIPEITRFAEENLGIYGVIPLSSNEYRIVILDGAFKEEIMKMGKIEADEKTRHLLTRLGLKYIENDDGTIEVMK